MKHVTTKKLIAIIIAVFAIATVSVFFLTACAPKDGFDIAFTDDVDMTRLETVTGDYDRNKPTLVYFHGLTENAERTTLFRPSEYDNVLDEGESNKPVTLKSNLADYWTEQDWNVFLFHYENETKNGADEFYMNLFTREILLQEFVNVYRLFFAADAANFDATLSAGTARSLPEIRFAGDSVGADFAAYAAAGLAQLVKNNLLSEFYLPMRLTLLNPHLDNKQYPEELQKLGAGLSPLMGVARATEIAATVGFVVGEMVESDAAYERSYAVPYTEQDTEAYNNILSRVAYLEIIESFSSVADWSPNLTETVSKVWYLATVGGSDYDSTGSSSVPSTMKNLLPFINTPKENYSNAISFCVSAWTPTTAIRGLQGLRFRSTDINSSETPKYSDRVITKFRLELFESSYLSQKNPRIGGYLFIDKNGDSYLNDGRRALMHEGIPVTMRYTVSGRDETSVTTHTAYDGFYSFEIPTEAYSCAVYLDFKTPDYRFKFGNKDTSGGRTNDELCSMSTASLTMNFVSSSWKDIYNMIKNSGYRYADAPEKD